MPKRVTFPPLRSVELREGGGLQRVDLCNSLSGLNRVVKFGLGQCGVEAGKRKEQKALQLTKTLLLLNSN